MLSLAGAQRCMHNEEIAFVINRLREFGESDKYAPSTTALATIRKIAKEPEDAIAFVGLVIALAWQIEGPCLERMREYLRAKLPELDRLFAERLDSGGELSTGSEGEVGEEAA